jgi:hypothetical protein
VEDGRLVEAAQKLRPDQFSWISMRLNVLGGPPDY